MYAVCNFQFGRLNCFIKNMGRNSKYIMAHHLFGFAILNLALLSFDVVEINKIGSLYTWKPGLTWPLYAVAGVGISYLLLFVWKLFNLDVKVFAKHY